MSSTLVPLQREVHGDSHLKWAGFLRANREAYARLIRRVEAAAIGPVNELLEAVALAARSASEFHPGIFADGAIENPALDAGADLFLSKAKRNDGSGDVGPSFGGVRRVLHVATQVAEIGGHTRMLQRWVESDSCSRHSLAVVRPEDAALPDWLSNAIQGSGGQIFAAPLRCGLAEKAIWLHETSQMYADLVVLHHDPADVVPTVAFAVRGGPPVARVNIADHQFWLGGSVSDIVISLRTAGAEHAAYRRFSSRNAVLPIPLVEPAERVSRADARRNLGIPEDQIVILTVGRPAKYRPCGSYDFVRTAGRFLERTPQAHLYVVGESRKGISPYLDCPVHDRLHLVGSLRDPSIYHVAADVYIESFPFGSQTALLEAALSGLPVVPAYAPLFPLLVANDDALSEIIPNPVCEQEYIDRVCDLVRSRRSRMELGASLRAALVADHVGEGWIHRLEEIYRETDRLRHKPNRLPISESHDEDGDVGLSLWHAAADGKNYSPGRFGDAIAIEAHAAFVAKYLGDFMNARRFALRSLRMDPTRWSSWRLLAVAGLGGAAQRFRAIRKES